MARRTYKPRRGYRRRARTYNRRALKSRITRRRLMYQAPRRGLRTYRFNKLVLGGFPPKKTVALRYVEDFTLNPGNASTSTYVFSVNNLYDPNTSGVGHQPMFFDNWSALYSKYKVNHATITFRALDNHIVNTTVNNQSSGTTVSTSQYFASNERAVRMFIVRDESGSDYTSKINTMIEEGNPNFRWKFAPQNTTGKMHTLKMRCWPNKQCNVPYNSSVLEGTVDGVTTPARPVYFICGVDSMPSSNADSMNYQVIITYNVTFFDFKENQSEN